MVEVIPARKSPGQANKTVNMNDHGRRFQENIFIVENQVILNTNKEGFIGKN